MNSAPGNSIYTFYRVFLGRTPEPQGLLYWVNKMGQWPTGDVVRGIWGSKEGIQDRQTASADLLSGRFSADKFPDSSLPYYFPNDALLEILGGEKYSALHPRDEDFVGALYQDLLKRAPDSQGQKFFVDSLKKGGSRAQVARTMLSSDEYDRAQSNQMYQDLLGRRADDGGASFWQGKPTLDKLNALASSEEFAKIARAKADACGSNETAVQSSLHAYSQEATMDDLSAPADVNGSPTAPAQ